jgi:hypothetical protein
MGLYAGDEAAWIAGLALLALGGAAYVADEAANAAETVRVKHWPPINYSTHIHRTIPSGRRRKTRNRLCTATSIPPE